MSDLVQSILCGQPGPVKVARTNHPAVPRPVTPSGRAAVIAGAGLLSAAVLLAQGAVPMGEEPHHRRLFYAAHLRMFELTVPPGGMTLDHLRDHDIVTVALGATEVRTGGPGADGTTVRGIAAGSADITNYTGAAAVHRVENVGKTPLRMFAFENLRDSGWSMPRLVTAPGTTLVQQSRAFAVYDVRLTGAAPRTNHVHAMPTLVMLVAGAVAVQGGGGESEFGMNAPGRWFPSMWDQPHSFMLLGSVDAHLVEVEAR